MNIEHHITNMEQWKLAFNMTVLVIALPFSPRAISKAILLLHILQLILPIEVMIVTAYLGIRRVNAFLFSAIFIQQEGG